MEKNTETSGHASMKGLSINKRSVEVMPSDSQKGEGFVVPKSSVLEMPQISHAKRKKSIFMRKNKRKKHSENIGAIIAEQFKSLKIKILHTQNGNLPRTLLVSSVFPSEGKSIVSTNLAITLAQGIREHALLVDCDFRKPDLHRLLGLTPEKGLSDYLSGNADLSEVLLKTHIPKLTLLPVGKRHSNPVDLLASEKMKQLIQELKSRYNDRYIIIDSSPIQLTTEPKFLLKEVEGVILVVKAGKTNRELLARIIQDIEKKKLLGIVLNGLEKSLSNRYYYGYYHYY